jgi:hypothetical protein
MLLTTDACFILVLLLKDVWKRENIFDVLLQLWFSLFLAALEKNLTAGSMKIIN